MAHGIEDAAAAAQQKAELTANAASVYASNPSAAPMAVSHEGHTSAQQNT